MVGKKLFLIARRNKDAAACRSGDQPASGTSRDPAAKRKLPLRESEREELLRLRETVSQLESRNRQLQSKLQASKCKRKHVDDSEEQESTDNSSENSTAENDRGNTPQSSDGEDRSQGAFHRSKGDNQGSDKSLTSGDTKATTSKQPIRIGRGISLEREVYEKLERPNMEPGKFACSLFRNLMRDKEGRLRGTEWWAKASKSGTNPAYAKYRKTKEAVIAHVSGIERIRKSKEKSAFALKIRNALNGIAYSSKQKLGRIKSNSDVQPATSPPKKNKPCRKYAKLDLQAPPENDEDRGKLGRGVASKQQRTKKASPDLEESRRHKLKNLKPLRQKSTTEHPAKNPKRVNFVTPNEYTRCSEEGARQKEPKLRRGVKKATTERAPGNSKRSIVVTSIVGSGYHADAHGRSEQDVTIIYESFKIPPIPKPRKGAKVLANTKNEEKKKLKPSAARYGHGTSIHPLPTLTRSISTNNQHGVSTSPAPNLSGINTGLSVSGNYHTFLTQLKLQRETILFQDMDFTWGETSGGIADLFSLLPDEKMNNAIINMYTRLVARKHCKADARVLGLDCLFEKSKSIIDEEPVAKRVTKASAGEYAFHKKNWKKAGRVPIYYIPFKQNGHWMVIEVVMKTRAINFYDSLKKPHEGIYQNLKNVLCEGMASIFGSASMENWYYHVMDVSQQKDESQSEYQSAAHMIMNLESLLRGTSLKFAADQHLQNELRRTMIRQVLESTEVGRALSAKYAADDELAYFIGLAHHKLNGATQAGLGASADNSSLQGQDVQESVNPIESTSSVPASGHQAMEKYSTSNIIGEGCFQVFQVTTSCFGEVAMKVFPDEKVKSLGMEFNMRQEIKIMTKLKHDNIVRMLKSEKCCLDGLGDCEVILMELMDCSLNDYSFENDQLDEESGRKMLSDIAKGLNYCHRNNIAHMDIKPDNILRNTNGTWKLSDFGLSEYMKPGTKLKVYAGTYGYMCPEICLRHPFYGKEADIFSLGVTLHDAMTRTYLFGTGTEREVMDKTILFPIDPRSRFTGNISENLRNLLTSILLVRATKRPTAKKILEHKWIKCGG